MKVQWNIFRCPPELRDELSKQLDIPPLIAQLLIKRGITDTQEGERFLSPLLQHLHDPFLMKDMEKGSDRILQALRNDEKITIYGDYDVDGITACTLMVDFLSSVGAKPSYYIPHRLKEGYGLNADVVNEISANGTKLLICVDCGISDRDEIQLAQKLGMDTIVVDHHEPPPLPSSAYAVLDPHQSDCHFPFKGLAGVGVAFYLVVALRSRLREKGFWENSSEPNLRNYLDLVALGTIADMVPLREENRILVAFGLQELARSERLGIQALREVAGTRGREEATAVEVGFYLAPRINAGGRLGDSRIGAELLLAKDLPEARGLAQKIEESNRTRQKEVERIFREAREKISDISSPARGRPVALVLAEEGWHPGVVGIVASRLLDEFYCPVCIISVAEGLGRGSGRSIPGISIHQILHNLSSQLVTFGGHERAVGFRILESAIPQFVQGFEMEVRDAIQAAPGDLEPQVEVDAELDFQEVAELEKVGLEQLSPFGIGNPEPVFLARDLRVKSREVIRSRHLKMVLDWGRVEIQAIGFGMANQYEIRENEILDILFHYRKEKNYWKGRGGNQLSDLIIKEVRRAGE